MPGARLVQTATPPLWWTREMTDVGTTAARTLAAIRIVNGTLALVAPHVLVRRTSDTTPVAGSTCRSGNDHE